MVSASLNVTGSAAESGAPGRPTSAFSPVIHGETVLKTT